MNALTFLDIGLTRDHTAAVTVHLEARTTVVVDDILHLVGTREKPVSFAAIEDHILKLHDRIDHYMCIADQWQARQLIQRLKAQRVRIGEVTVGAAYHDKIARNLLELVGAGRVKCFSHEGLAKQLGAVVLRRSTATSRDDSSVRVKIDSGAGAGVAGRDDIVVALAGAAFEATDARRLSPSCATIQIGEGYFGHRRVFKNLRDELNYCKEQDAERARLVRRELAAQDDERTRLVAQYGEAAVAAIRSARYGA
jgi:hypothetical protein